MIKEIQYHNNKKKKHIKRWARGKTREVKYLTKNSSHQTSKKWSCDIQTMKSFSQIETISTMSPNGDYVLIVFINKQIKEEDISF